MAQANSSSQSNAMNRRKMRKVLPAKEFILRNSLLIDLFENKHIRTVYHMFLATFVALFVNTTMHDYLKNGKVILGLKFIKLAFGNFHFVILGWLLFFSMAITAFFCFKIWVKFRPTELKNTIQMWDKFWLLVLITYYVVSFRFCAFWISKFELPPVSALSIAVEQTRFLMKIHAFIRENSPKIINFKQHTESSLTLPKFRQFLYFLFAPTLLYRDQYPRNKKIRWMFALWRFSEVIAAIFYLSFIIDRFLIPTVSQFCTETFTVSRIVLVIFENTIVGILMLLPNFFLILHSWQNVFAELLRFGDRMFYQDWWTCTSLSDFFRKWNVVVHDWLYTYLYKDMIEIVAPNNKFVSKFIVFLVSAIVHEWLLMVMFGFFFPLLFFEFFLGVLLNCFRPPKIAIMNILFLYALGIGMGILVSMYSLEYYAKLNAPLIENYLVPTFLSCINGRFYESRISIGITIPE